MCYPAILAIRVGRIRQHADAARRFTQYSGNERMPQRLYASHVGFVNDHVQLAHQGTNAAAQTLRPCCEGGSQANKPCNTDQNCKGVCVGGHRDGKTCRDDTKCPAACVGGDNDGGRCLVDEDCPGGSCGAVGTCDPGTCTALCVKGKPPKTPSDPAASWLDDRRARPVSAVRVCP